MAIQPFVGICGVQNSAEFTRILRAAPAILKGTDRFVMVGVKRVTAPAMIQGVFNTVRPFVHCNFTGRAAFEGLIEHNIRQSQGFVRGLQLNVAPWMEVNLAPLLHRVKRRHPGVSLMLQAHHVIMARYAPQQIAARLCGLPLDYTLFDASQSRGVAYDPEYMRSYVSAIYKARLRLGVVVAGGLGRNMGRLFAPLLRDYPALSCDAFGKLQDPRTQALSFSRVDAYLSGWKNAFVPEYSDSVGAKNLVFSGTRQPHAPQALFDAR